MNKVAKLIEIEKKLNSPNENDRWNGAVAAGELVFDEPDTAWKLGITYGSGNLPDMQAAIATCVLEHLLEHHFERYFPELEKIIRSGNRAMGTTSRMCWKMGQSSLPENDRKWDELTNWTD